MMKKDAQILDKLELLLSCPIPKMEQYASRKFGFVIELPNLQNLLISVHWLSEFDDSNLKQLEKKGCKVKI